MESESGLRVKLKASVEACDLIMFLYEIVRSGGKSDAALTAYVMLEAQHTDVGFLVEQGKVKGIKALIADKIARTFIGCEHQSVRVAPGLADEFDGDFRVDDRACVNDV